MTTAPVTDIALNDINNVSAASLAQIKFCNGMDLHGSMLMPLVVLRQELDTTSSNPSGAMSNIRYTQLMIT